MSAELRRRELIVDGLRLSYLEWGNAQAGRPSLLYLHGLIATAETAVSLGEELAANYHVLALDLPGAGDSERRTGLDASLFAMASMVRGFVDSLDLKQVVLVGHSHGGAVSLQLASDTPQRWYGVVLLSPAHPFSSHVDPLIRFYVTVMGRAFANVLPWLPRSVHLIGFRRMAGPGSWGEPRQIEPYRRNLRTQGTVAHLLRLLGTWKHDMACLGTALEARPLLVPTLLLWGDRDRAVPHTTAPALERHLCISELVLLPGIGHRPAEEAPAKCAALIRAWLIRRDTQPEPNDVPISGV